MPSRRDGQAPGGGQDPSREAVASKTPAPDRVGSYGRRGSGVSGSDPLAALLVRLGRETWVDYVSPGLSGLAADPAAYGLEPSARGTLPPASLLHLLELQNGARYGRGWLLLLGVGRPRMDLAQVNRSPAVRSRYGQKGWFFGLTAFGALLSFQEGGSGGSGGSVVLCLRDGARRELAADLESFLSRLGRDPDLRERIGPEEQVKRCRAMAGELPPGSFYEVTTEGAGTSAGVVRVTALLGEAPGPSGGAGPGGGAAGP